MMSMGEPSMNKQKLARTPQSKQFSFLIKPGNLLVPFHA